MKHIGKLLLSLTLIVCCLAGLAMGAHATTTVTVNAISNHANGWVVSGSAPGIYFTAAANNAPYAQDRSVTYAPSSSGCIKVINGSETTEIGSSTYGLKLIKFSETEYCLTSDLLSNPLFASQIVSKLTNGTLLIEGDFEGADATIKFAKIKMELLDGGSTVFTSCGATVAETVITQQPENSYVSAGNTAVFSVTATGDGLLYQWQCRTAPGNAWNNSNATGNTTRYLQIAATTTRHNYEYRCCITNSAGATVYTDAAALHVFGVKTQPSSQVVKSGATAKFTVSATGKGLSYQWQYRTSSSGSWTNTKATGYNTKSLSISATTAKHGYQYRCRITDSAGTKAYTKTVTMYVLGIKTQPSGKTVVAGNTARFTVSAVGKDLSYQWQYRTSSSGSWKNVSSASGKTRAYSVTTAAKHHGYQYRCRITDSSGNRVYTKTVSLYVLGIKTQPVSKSVKVGATAKFTVSAVGKGLTYQWQYRTSSSGSWKNVSASSGKKAAYSLTAASRHNGYQYRCRITDSAGNVIYSNVVKLTVK